ncbi:hypothetical protein ACJMK2_021609 [Sinanodonta woodiana]|uniref:C-type lectin domain-containing protein n=1 Tax=Sinanodonta woodiana TaxID=1069815 RepID=A0ABD3TIJ7_SINWO
MNLIQIGFLSLALLALADGYLLSSGGGFGGISSIFSILLIFLVIAAVARRSKNCPANYIPIPNDQGSCISFVTSPTKNFDDALAACESEGGRLLRLSTATFPLIQELAQNRSGTCSYWVGTNEGPDDGTDSMWVDVDGGPIPTTPGLFFFDSTNSIPNECGLMSNSQSFLLLGETCTVAHCYICEKNI